jgi:hypothetical protein
VILLISELGTNVSYQLYVAIHEWQTGKQLRAEFSGKAFLDVYDSHIDMFRDIANRRNGAFHVTLCDIYAKARCVSVLMGRHITTDQLL